MAQGFTRPQSGANGAPGDNGPHFIFGSQGLGATHDIGYIAGVGHFIPGAFSTYTFAAAKQVSVFPHFERRGGLLRNINTEVTGTAGAGSKVYRLGIYNSDVGAGSIYPGTKLYESADISNATGGIKTVSASMPTLVANTLYWVAMEDADGLANYRSLTTAGITVGIQLDGASTLTGFVRGFLQTLGAYGTLPSPWGTTLTYEGNTSYPMVVFTYAS